MDLIMSANEGYKIKNIFVMDYVPKIYKKIVKSRPASTFMYIVDGAYSYKGKDFAFSPMSGDIIYLPKNSNYTYSIISDKAHCIQITFEIDYIKSNQNGFLNSPFVFNDNECIERFHSVYKNYSNNEEFSVLSDIYKIISVYYAKYNGEIEPDSDYKKIKPAVDYINQNFSSKLYVSELANICEMSQSQLRRLFLKNFGMSPIQYKNHILISNACNLLINEGMNVNEVVNSLNFTDVYSFSKLFKKEMGISPKNWISGKVIYRKN